MNTYISAHDYNRAVTGQEKASLYGTLMRISGTGVTAGQTALPVTPSLLVPVNQYDLITIFDGSNTEEVVVQSTANAGTTSVTVSAFAFNHAAGTSCCSDGASGSLAQAIEIASGHLESITQQSLLQQSYSETYNLRTMEANITNDWTLSIRPRHFPVSSVTALSLETSVATVLTVDPTQAIIETRKRLVNVPVISQVGTGPTSLILRPPLDRTSAGFVNMTYTAGFAYSSLPWDIKQACILLTSTVLSDRWNPTGAADYQSGKVHTTVFLRGDLSGEIALYKRAEALLAPYTRQL